jgi:hypothetical protein
METRKEEFNSDNPGHLVSIVSVPKENLPVVSTAHHVEPAS